MIKLKKILKFNLWKVPTISRYMVDVLRALIYDVWEVFSTIFSENSKI